jgi:predicted RNA-binding Zn ribbon-like protein
VDLLAGEEAKKIEQKWGGQVEGRQTLEQARAFRRTLQSMVERMTTGEAVPQAALTVIDRLLPYRVGCSQLKRGEGGWGRVFHSASSDANQLLGLLATAASDLLCQCDFSLIKRCQNPPCTLFFYDTSKNHTRHWCSMSICGNRNKVAAHYRKHRSQSA